MISFNRLIMIVIWSYLKTYIFLYQKTYFPDSSHYLRRQTIFLSNSSISFRVTLALSRALTAKSSLLDA